MIVYGTHVRQIFSRRRAIWTLGHKINVTAKDNGDGTATVWEKIWDEDGQEGVAKHNAVPLSQIAFLND